ncbi:MAG TPA: hypothetical protein VJ828_10635 [Lacipirellulaceae bacterium]|nr:hypothetical protein [Lacipirellulaceae bacterium]
MSGQHGCWLGSLGGHRHWWAAVLCLFVAVAGCDKGIAGRSRVHGTVTVNGTPPASGAIAFTPVDGAAPTAGGEIVDGKYSVDVPIGQSMVAIRVPRVVGQRKLYNTPDSPVQPTMEESLPAKFNDETELTIDVKPGETQGDFDLKTK